MRTTAKFQKVSIEQFASDCQVDNAQQIYEDIKMPCRATVGSAGYDIFAPFAFTIEPQQSITIPTGIRILMPTRWVLLIYPRSGLGFRYRLRLNNTVGVIDSDYSNSDNQGHIFIRVTNEGTTIIQIDKGEAFAQAMLTSYYLTEDDDVATLRNGGLGSTDKQHS